MTFARGSFRRVSKNALARLVAQVGARLLSLVLVAMVARYESAAGLGRYVLVLTVLGFAGALTDLGLNVYLTREVARESDRWRQSELLGRVLPLKLGLSAIGLAGLVVVALFASLARRIKAPFGAGRVAAECRKRPWAQHALTPTAVSAWR